VLAVLYPLSAGADEFCADFWTKLTADGRLQFAKAADEKAVLKAPTPQREELTSCFERNRSRLVERLTALCGGSGVAPESLVSELEQHVQRCVNEVWQHSTRPPRNQSDLDPLAEEALRRCREASVLDHKASQLEALYNERARLEDELRRISAEVRRELEEIREEGARASSARGLEIAVDRQKLLLASGSYRRMLDLPFVLDEFTTRCIWTAEDRADAADPQARAARAIERQRWYEERDEARNRRSEATDRALDPLVNSGRADGEDQE
jgi:hypothetical protein